MSSYARALLDLERELQADARERTAACAAVNKPVVKDDGATRPDFESYGSRHLGVVIQPRLDQIVTDLTVVRPVAQMRTGNNTQSVDTRLAMDGYPHFDTIHVGRGVAMPELPEPCISVKRPYILGLEGTDDSPDHVAVANVLDICDFEGTEFLTQRLEDRH